MIHHVVLLALFAFLLAGCADAHRPSVRGSAAPSSGSVHPKMMPAGSGAGDRGGPLVNLESPRVDLGKMCLTAPESWVRKQPRIEFILAEFELPRADGDEADGRLTVSTAGGSIAENVRRWRGQFGEKPERESRKEIEIAGINVTLVDFSGTYLEQRGPFAPAEQREGYRVLGAIIPLEGQSYFVKGSGPEKTMAARAAEIQAFVRSLKSSGPPE